MTGRALPKWAADIQPIGKDEAELAIVITAAHPPL